MKNIKYRTSFSSGSDEPTKSHDKKDWQSIKPGTKYARRRKLVSDTIDFIKAVGGNNIFYISLLVSY